MVITPGRLLNHIKITMGFSIRHLKHLFLDEPDELLDLDLGAYVTSKPYITTICLCRLVAATRLQWEHFIALRNLTKVARDSAINNFKTTGLMTSGHPCPVPSHTHALAILLRPLLCSPYFLSFSFRITSLNPPRNNQQLPPLLDFLYLLSLPNS